MARKRRPEPGGARARLFVALEPPAETQAALAGWRDEAVSGREDLRPVRASALHVTLAFLGWRDEGEAEAILEAVRGAAAGVAAPRLVPAGVEPVPPRAPRLFALDLGDDDGRCTALQAAVSRALEAGRFYRPERRPFWPHMTLARVKRGRRAAPLDPPSLPRAFDAPQITLYRSTLRPQGAVYDPLGRAELGA